MLLLIWFGVMLLPSILSGDAPHFGRLVGIVAPVSIFAAVKVLTVVTTLNFFMVPSALAME